MVDRREAIRIFNTERDYEDNIAEDILGFLNFSLNEISDMSEEEKEFVREVFSTIRNESLGHGQQFTKLIEHCLEDGKDNY